MSDACFEGYHCCDRPMEAVRLPTLAGDRVVAWLCDCGIWRHATSPHRDADLRAKVAARMEEYVPMVLAYKAAAAASNQT